MVAFLAQVLVWGTFTESKLCTVNLMQQHSYGNTVWGKIRTRLMFPKGIAFSKLWGRLCDGKMSSLPQWTWMPLFSCHFSTPLVSESSPAGAALPSQSSHHGQKTEQCSTQAEPEASPGFTQYSLNCSISGTARGSQHQSRCHRGHEGGNVQFSASVKMIFSNWPFLGFPKGVKSRRIMCLCLTNIF